jgi:hypothetical protein
MISARIRFVFPCLAALFLVRLSFASEVVVDEALGFSLTLPGGFVPIRRDTESLQHFAHAFVLGDLGDDELDITLFISDLRGLIENKRLTPKDIPAGFNARLTTRHWQGFTVNVVESSQRVEGMDLVAYAVLIPLKRSAIRMEVTGPVDRKQEIEAQLDQLLNGLDGESNWLRSAFPTAPITSSESYGTVLWACAIAFIGAGLICFRIVDRKAQKGTVLAIGITLYLLGVAREDVPLREVVFLMSSLKILGCIGVFWGLVNLSGRSTSSHDLSHDHAP